ncbi:MAG: hemerythrin domain-containing protein [Bacteroidetes bacterium]|nr:hemerythrin domain-containing protein [Bacteroidota bacterium]
MMDLKNLNKIDPLKRMVEKQTGEEELSPMDPPDAFNPPAVDDISYDDMHPVLQKLMDEHVACTGEIDAFEEVIGSLFKDGFTKQVSEGITKFYRFFDNSIIIHNRKEDRGIFPVLQEKLLEKGEYSVSNEKVTVVDLMEDDHSKAMQLAAISFNLFGLAPRIPDNNSRLMILDLAVEQSKTLIELLKLHIFREDHIIFPLVQQYLAKEELDTYS